MRRFGIFPLSLLLVVVGQGDAFCFGVSSSNETEPQVVAQAQSLIASGQLDEAQSILAQGLVNFPRSSPLYNLVGIVAGERKQNHAAEDAFLTALQYSPASTHTLLNLARVLHAQGKDDSAIATYQRALRFDKSLTEAHANLAALLLERGDYRGTLGHIALLPSATQTQNRYLAMKAVAQAGNGNRGVAAETAKQLSAAATEQDLSLSVYVLGQLNENSLLIDLANRVPLERSSKEFRGLMATAYAKNGEAAKARALYESVARDDPSSVKPLIDAAHVAYEQHDFEGAAGYLIHAVKSDPNNADAQFFLGIACINLNLPLDAIQALREAVRIRPDNAAVNYALGAALLTSSDKDSSKQYFQKYIQLRPDDPHGKLAMGVADFEVGDLEAAKNQFTQLLDNPIVSSGALYILGKICREQDDLDCAVKYLTRAAERSSSDPSVYANLGAIYVRKGDFTQARDALDHALSLDADNYLANESMLMLLQKQKDPSAKVQADHFAALTEKKSEEQQLLLRHIDAW